MKDIEELSKVDITTEDLNNELLDINFEELRKGQQLVIFTEWLKEQGAYDEYMKFFDEGWDSDFSYDSPKTYISCAFDWGETSEDADYWDNLNIQWAECRTTAHYIVFSEDYTTEVVKPPQDVVHTNERVERLEDSVAEKDKPKQYKIGIDTFERMRANASLEEAMGFIRWNIDKYNTRKKDQDISDYGKIKDYCDEAIWWLKNKG